MRVNPTLIACAIGAAALVSRGSAIAQESEHKIQMKDLPAAVKKTVDQQAKAGKLRGLSKEIEKGVTYYEAELTVNGRAKDVLLDATGNVVEVEDEVDAASLAPAVRAGLEQLAAGGKILRVESVTRGGSVAYEAVVEKNGKKSEIKVGADGKPIPESK